MIGLRKLKGWKLSLVVAGVFAVFAFSFLPLFFLVDSGVSLSPELRAESLTFDEKEVLRSAQNEFYGSGGTRIREFVNFAEGKSLGKIKETCLNEKAFGEEGINFCLRYAAIANPSEKERL